MKNGAVTILDVAAAAQVSPATVSHTLNGKRPVSVETREHVLRVIDELGYVPSWNASRLKTGKSGIIGCMAVDITETFVNHIVKGIEQGIAGAGYSLFFVSAIEFENDIDKAYEFLKSNQVDGMIFCHHIPFSNKMALKDTKREVPMVSINMSTDNMVSVIPDNYTGGYQAAEHLFSCGMRNPAMICGPEDRLSVIDRQKGFVKKLHELGMDGKIQNFYYGNYDYDHGYDAAKKIMDSNPKTDGIFCANDYIAAGALTFLQEKGIGVPYQVRVLGFDDRDFASFWPTPISTFLQPLQEMGMLGFSLLQHLMATGSVHHRQHTLQSKLVARKSTIG